MLMMAKGLCNVKCRNYRHSNTSRRRAKKTSPQESTEKISVPSAISVVKSAFGCGQSRAVVKCSFGVAGAAHDALAFVRSTEGISLLHKII
jgi:hypothetical protein